MILDVIGALRTSTSSDYPDVRSCKLLLQFFGGPETTILLNSGSLSVEHIT